MTTDRITFDPKILRGKPCVRGIRSPVAMVVEILEDGITFAQIVMDYYPQLLYRTSGKIERGSARMMRMSTDFFEFYPRKSAESASSAFYFEPSRVIVR